MAAQLGGKGLGIDWLRVISNPIIFFRMHDLFCGNRKVRVDFIHGIPGGILLPYLLQEGCAVAIGKNQGFFQELRGGF
jgi:hypothetical protein